MCNNTIEQVIPTRYSAKVIKQKCGSTSIYGEAQYCEECLKAGMRSVPAYLCEDAGDDDRDPNWRYEPC